MQALSIKSEKFFWMLKGIVLLNILFVIWTLLCSSIIVCDDIEHLRASYFISLGEVPYRDFFEHHHPLLWYVLWPLIKILPQSTLISIYIGRAISFLISLGTGYYFYRIMRRFVGGKTVALLAIILYFASLPAWYSMINVKPDIYMRLFYFGGLYHLFLYFQRKKLQDLCICGVFWTVGFLFLQTLALLVLPLIIPVIWFLYHHPRQIKNFLLAAVIPLLILAGFVGILCYSGTWEAYFETNWLFNSQMSDFLSRLPQRKGLVVFADMILMASVAAIFYLRTSRGKNIYMISLILLFVCELLQRVFWVAIFSQYYVMFCAFAAMVTAPMAYKILRWESKVFYVLIMFLAIHAFVNFKSLSKHVMFEQAFYYLEQEDQPRNEAYGLNCGIYQAREAYYWTLPDVEGLHDIYYNRGQDYDINELLDREDIRYYCSSGERESKFPKYMEKMLDLTAEQKAALQRHLLNDEFQQKYRLISDKLYEKNSSTDEKIKDNH